jgi:hypothetical protein
MNLPSSGANTSLAMVTEHSTRKTPAGSARCFSSKSSPSLNDCKARLQEANIPSLGPSVQVLADSDEQVVSLSVPPDVLTTCSLSRWALAGLERRRSAFRLEQQRRKSERHSNREVCAYAILYCVCAAHGRSARYVTMPTNKPRISMAGRRGPRWSNS